MNSEEPQQYWKSCMLQTREEILFWLDLAKEAKNEYWFNAYTAQLRRWDAAHGKTS